MPPWLAEPTTTGGGYIGERRLTLGQIATLQHWAETGALEGEPVAKASPPQLSSGWQRGEPDFVIALAEPYTIAADGSEVLRTFVLATNLELDRAVEAIEFRSGNDRAVHHAAFLADSTGNARLLDRADAAVGYPAMGDIGVNRIGTFGSWSPSAPVFELPSGYALKLPADADLVVETHFNQSGKREAIHPQLGVYFAKGPARKVMALTLGSFAIDIPAGEKEHRIVDRVQLPVGVEVIAISPHAHYVCQKVHASAVKPDGARLDLLTINDWDFNWQQTFRFRTPVRLEAGAWIEIEFVYDNSEANPQNPSHPPQRVRNGMGKADEMATIIIHVAVDSVADAQAIEAADHKHQLREMAR